MYIKQADLFNGVSIHFVKKVMDIAVQESHEEGTMLFHHGDPSSQFYILIKGKVKLSTGRAWQKVYIGSQTGDFFGWSSLVGRTEYTASAECIEPTDLLKIDKDRFLLILDDDLANGFIFYRNLATALGDRLINSYQLITEIVP